MRGFVLGFGFELEDLVLGFVLDLGLVVEVLDLGLEVVELDLGLVSVLGFVLELLVSFVDRGFA